MMGIYKITNKINGKVYIGQSVDVDKRWIIHKSMVRTQPDRTLPLYVAMRKYGIENFIFEPIEECKQEELNEREIYWIKYYNSYGSDGYNATIGGDSGALYDYEQIFNLWKQGHSCKQIQEIIGCANNTVTKALRAFKISEEDARKRAVKRKKYVALDPITKEPLKIFDGQNSVSKFFLGKEKQGCITESIIKGWKLFGYYWEVLNEHNIPINELSDEEFLSYKAEPKQSYSKEQKIEQSLKKRTRERPSREELKALIRNKSFLEISRMFNVSDNAIRKWCDFENLPRKKKDINSYSDEEWELI